MTRWQEETLEILIAYFEAKEDILALLVFGSLSSPEEGWDDWSDIDLLLVVEPGAIQNFYARIDWLEAFGHVYAYDQSENESRKVTRVCFDDMRRVDFVFTTEEKLADVMIWPRNPMQDGARTLFSRSDIVNEIATRFHREPVPGKLSQDRFNALVRQFYFKGMLAVYKIARDDQLIALHLALDMVRDCAFMGMALRDRLVGMEFHKTGGIGNRYAQDLNQLQRSFTPQGILEMIEGSIRLFDTWAKEWDEEYDVSKQPILEWIEKARLDIKS